LCLDIYKDVDEGMPLADELAKFVSGHVQSIERGPAEPTFNILHLQLHFPPEHVVSLGLQVSQGGLNYSAFDHFS